MKTNHGPTIWQCYFTMVLPKNDIYYCTSVVVDIQSNSSYLLLRHRNAIRVVLCEWFKLIFLNRVKSSLAAEGDVCEWQWVPHTGFIWSDLRWNAKHPPVLPQPPLTWDQPLVSVRIVNQASAHLYSTNSCWIKSDEKKGQGATKSWHTNINGSKIFKCPHQK